MPSSSSEGYTATKYKQSLSKCVMNGTLSILLTFCFLIQFPYNEIDTQHFMPLENGVSIVGHNADTHLQPKAV